jgi:MFS family permease
MTRRLPALLALSLGLVLNGIGFGAIGVASSVGALALTVVIWTFGEMVFSPVGAAYVADIAPPDLRGRYQASWGFTFSLGLMLAPIGGALLYSVRPALLWSICLALCLAAASLLTTAWMGERRATAGAERKIGAATGPVFADEPAARVD